MFSHREGRRAVRYICCSFPLTFKTVHCTMELNTNETITIFIFLRKCLYVIWFEILQLQTSTIHKVEYKSKRQKMSLQRNGITHGESLINKHCWEEVCRDILNV